MGDIEVPKSVIFIMPIFMEGDLERAEDIFKEKVKGIQLRSLIITEIVLGEVCYRKFDNAYSRHHNALIEEYKLLQPKKKEVY